MAMSEQQRRRMSTETAHLRAALRSVRQVNKRLREANANLRVERDAVDVLLGSAMDELLGGSNP
jgi:hypothetical protein